MWSMKGDGDLPSFSFLLFGELVIPKVTTVELFSAQAYMAPNSS